MSSPITTQSPLSFLFPKTVAYAVQTRLHGEQGVAAAKEAAKAPDKAARLDAALRAADNFDHAIISSEQLPLGSLVSNLPLYYAGYGAAKIAIGLIVRSGVVPGAKELVSRSEVTQAQSHFHAGLEEYASAEGRSRYGRYRTSDWLTASIADARDGLRMLGKPELAQPLLQGLADTRTAAQHKQAIDPARVQAIDELFRKATSGYDALVAAKGSEPAGAAAPAGASAAPALPLG